MIATKNMRSKILVSAVSREKVLKLFNGLSAGGSIEVPLDDSAEGACFGMFRDKFGIEWIVEFDSKE